MLRKHLITEDELREAGALDVPEGWRKSLGSEKSLFDMAADESHEEQSDTEMKRKHAPKPSKKSQ